MERLDKIIANRTGLSRKEAKAAVAAGRVTVGGVAAKSAEQKIDDEEIFLDGNKISGKAHLYIVLNKPKGYVSATEDAEQKTVLELVPEELFRAGLFPAGRLDKDTTGLMIITDDGDFAHRILAPRKHVPKEYEVEIDIPVTEEMAEGFANGVELIDGVCKTSSLIKTGDFTARVTLSEGRYHQIKRMFGCFGAKVTELHRIRMGKFYLPENLAPGECRELTEDELILIESRV